MAFDVTFINAEGTALNLNDGLNTWITIGVANDLMPVFSFQERTSPLIPGSLISSVRVEPRDLVIPIILLEEDRNMALARARQMISILDPRLGDGRLLVANGDETRVLICRLKDGFASDGSGNEQFSDNMRLMLTFRASDPFFYALNSIVLTAGQNFAPKNFFPIFPVLFSQSSVSTNANLINSGNENAWPIITITGPGNSFLITNVTIGKKIEVTTAINAGEVITIDTRPRTRGVRDAFGVNRFSLLTALSSFFPMKKGDNSITIEISGGDVNTLVTVEYTPTYLSS